MLRRLPTERSVFPSLAVPSVLLEVRFFDNLPALHDLLRGSAGWQDGAVLYSLEFLRPRRRAVNHRGQRWKVKGEGIDVRWRFLAISARSWPNSPSRASVHMN